jgi:hypothetical protein
MAAQTFNRWGHLGVWERMLEVTQERGVALGMAFLDGTTIRAHQKQALVVHFRRMVPTGVARKARPADPQAGLIRLAWTTALERRADVH